MGITPINVALVAAVRQHALANYNKDGWDYIVECWDDSEIDEEIRDCVTTADAVAKMHRVAKLLDERRSEVQSEAW